MRKVIIVVKYLHKMHIATLLGLLFICQILQAQNDTILQPDTNSPSRTPQTESRKSPTDTIAEEQHSPQQATLYSAVLPGLGQAYNKKYWKIPIIYGGFTALIYLTRRNHRLYKDYKKGYADFIDDDQTTTSYEQLNNVSLETNDKYIKEQLRYYKDEYRRSRDLMIIFTGGLYVLNIIDAMVDAHFYDYDVSDDLSLNVKPKFYTYAPERLGIQCKLTF